MNNYQWIAGIAMSMWVSLVLLTFLKPQTWIQKWRKVLVPVVLLLTVVLIVLVEIAP